MNKLRRVLLVDDSKADLFLHRWALESIACAERIDVAPHGRAALAYLRDIKATRSAAPELVLMDVNLPVLDGWEVLERSVREELLDPRRTAVVMLSTSIDPNWTRRPESAPQVRAFLSKPLTADKLRGLWADSVVHASDLETVK